tara:strand:+ start:51 stop:167 length:117 start_codon:yes stop_codon:yes gene_type:complete
MWEVVCCGLFRTIAPEDVQDTGAAERTPAASLSILRFR